MSPSPETQARIINQDFSNTIENETSPTDEDDEYDLYPDVLELPPLRSPRGSISSLYGSRHAVIPFQGMGRHVLACARIIMYISYMLILYVYVCVYIYIHCIYIIYIYICVCVW